MAQERAEAIIVLSREQGFPEWLALGNYHCGAGLWPYEDKEKRVFQQIHQGMACLAGGGE